MDEERVEYSFVGDVSSLRSATQEAISLLDKYEGTIKNLASSNQFSVSKTVFTGFQRTVNSLIKQTNTLAAFMNKTSKTTQEALTPSTDSINQAVADVSDVLQYLQTSTSVTSEDIKFLNTVLKDAQSTMSMVAARAQALGSSFASVAKLETQAAATTESATTRISSAQRAMIQNAPFVAYAQQVEASFGKVTKSAEESMQVFVAAGKMSPLAAGIDNATSKLLQYKASVDSLTESIRSRFAKIATVFDPVKVQLQSFKDKASSAMSYVRGLTDTVSAAFRRLALSTDSAESEANQSSAAHKNLGKTLQSLLGTLKSERKAIANEDEELEDVNETLEESEDKHGDLANAVKSLGSIFGSGSKKAGLFGSSMKALNKLAQQVKQAVAGLIGINLTQWVAQGIKSSIDLTERFNLFQVAMGDSVDQGLKFVKNMSEVYGMDPGNLYKTSGYFYQLTDAIGMTDAASSVLSLSLTKASNDIASLFNVDVQTVVDDLASGMQGMSRSVRKYGMDIRATTLEQIALELGITDQVETMTEANRMALRYIAMMRQVSNATQQVTTSIDGTTEVTGDFARTIESPANQLRIFTEQINQLARAIGNFFVPVLREVMPYINGLVMSLRLMLTFIAALSGFTEDLSDNLAGTVDSSSAIDAIGDSAAETTKKLNKMLAPFDELNVLSSNQEASEGVSSDIVDPRLQDVISSMSLELENIEMQANKVRDSILRFLGFKAEGGDIFNWNSESLEKNLISKFPRWSATITAAFNNWTDLVAGFKAVLDSLGAVFESLGEKLSTFFSKLFNNDNSVNWIESLSASLPKLAEWIAQNSDAFADFIITVGSLAAVFQILVPMIGKAFSAISAVGQIAPTLASVGAAIAPLLGVFAIVLAVVAAITLLYNTSVSFRDGVAGLGSRVYQSLQAPFEALSGIFNTLKADIIDLWHNTLLPFLEAMGAAVAPVLSSVGDLWENLMGIFTSLVQSLERVWSKTLKPVIESVFQFIGTIADFFKRVWNDVLGPVINYIGDGIENLWNKYLQPICEKIINIVGGIIVVILELWNNVLYPLITWIWNTLAPLVTNVLVAIWDAIEWVIGLIGGVIDSLLGMIMGIVDFLVGVFTGDWKKALSGLVNIFGSAGNLIIGLVESIVNGVIDIINDLWRLLYSGIAGVVSGIGSMISDIAGLLGYDIEIALTTTAPTIPHLSIPRIPEAALASGGVVTSPTRALIGEGKYDEAVIPLGNSPQMRDLVTEIANAVNGKSSDEPMQINVYIGNEQVAEYMHRAERKRALQTNGGI